MSKNPVKITMPNTGDYTQVSASSGGSTAENSTSCSQLGERLASAAATSTKYAGHMAAAILVNSLMAAGLFAAAGALVGYGAALRSEPCNQEPNNHAVEACAITSGNIARGAGLGAEIGAAAATLLTLGYGMFVEPSIKGAKNALKGGFLACAFVCGAAFSNS